MTLLFALLLPVCMPSNDEPEWPAELEELPSLRSDPREGGLGLKCDDVYALEGAEAVCRSSLPPLEAATAWEKVWLDMRKTSGTGYVPASVARRWRTQLVLIAPHLTRSTMRPKAKCIGPVP